MQQKIVIFSQDIGVRLRISPVSGLYRKYLNTWLEMRSKTCEKCWSGCDTHWKASQPFLSQPTGLMAVIPMLPSAMLKLGFPQPVFQSLVLSKEQNPNPLELASPTLTAPYLLACPPCTPCLQYTILSLISLLRGVLSIDYWWQVVLTCVHRGGYPTLIPSFRGININLYYTIGHTHNLGPKEPFLTSAQAALDRSYTYDGLLHSMKQT